ncbi:MAG TPA: AraC family transcriptional regulator [Draconibacterium sp.]|jgi:AraC-like DNA-binding protein/mannose-6-phosphate isomerase-like protein (cupin superfamily)|nr:AraC family transcriptional regulator [Draconibacterium sp.]
MKIMHEHIDFPGRSAVKVKLREMPHFTYPWHFHPEYEILYVIDGSGTSFVADSIEEFQSGDLALIGSTLPHFWRSDEKYLNSEGKLKVKYIVIQFPTGFLKDEIANYPEYHLIGDLLERASRGIRFSADFARGIEKKITRLSKSNGFERIIHLQELLQALAKTQDYKLLAGELYQHENLTFTNFRLTKVLQFLNTNYQRKIELETVADIANLHPAAFCRFFKEKTGKSLSEYLNDMRIGYACRLIIEGKLSVSQISYESGFNNLSNFNRTFKRHAKMTPTEYFQRFHGNI